MVRGWKLGLRARLVLILLAAFIASSGLLIWHSSVQREQLLQDAAGNLQNRARLLALKRQSLADRGDAILNGLMAASALGWKADGEECARGLAEYFKPEPAFLQAGRVSPGGEVLCTAVPAGPGANVADRPWFRQALAHRGMVISEVMAGTDPARSVIILAKGMGDGAGNVQAVHYLSLSLGWLQRSLLEEGVAEGEQVALIDGQAREVARHPNGEGGSRPGLAGAPLVKRILAEGGEGVATVDGPGGDPGLLAYVPLLRSASGSQYYLLLYQPLSRTTDPVRQQLVWSLALALAILVGTLLLVLWGGRRYVEQPLGILSLIAHDFGMGNFDARRRLPTGSGEIGELSQALKEMAAKLQKSTVSRRRLQVEIDNHKLAKERLRLALDSANAACFEWNVETGETVWSEKMWSLLGLGPEGATASYGAWRESVHPDDLERMERTIKGAVAKGEEFEAEWRIRSPAPAPRWLMGRGRPLREEGKPITRYFGVILDVSERKQSEQALARYRDHLEDLVAERTAQLLSTHRDLEGFTYAASHDMKAPLGRINSFCSLLGQRYRNHLEGDGITFLDLIQQNAQRLSILVDDLLAHAQVSQHPLQLQAVDIAAIARAVVDERSQDVREVGGQVRIDLPEHLLVRGTPIGIGQVLRNLLENALKYSAQAEAPLVEIGALIHGRTCRVWVRDNGIGIDESYHEKIFEIFRRLHTYNEYPGNGIGLALVKKAMERMGGRVWVESELGQGATFFLEFGVAAEQPEPAPAGTPD